MLTKNDYIRNCRVVSAIRDAFTVLNNVDPSRYGEYTKAHIDAVDIIIDAISNTHAEDVAEKWKIIQAENIKAAKEATDRISVKTTRLHAAVKAHAVAKAISTIKQSGFY